MTKRLTLVTGGARSGKSAFAQQLAGRRGGEEVLFVATAEPGDDEMVARIAAHRATRPATWRTVEVKRAVALALEMELPARVVLLDCVTLWTSNVLIAEGARAERAMAAEVDDLLTWFRSNDTNLVIVSNEVGMGLVPPSEIGRQFRDLLGAVNRKIAAAADEVYFLVAGLPVEVKALSFENCI